MKKEAMSFLQWQRRFGEEDAYQAYLFKERWPQGF